MAASALTPPRSMRNDPVFEETFELSDAVPPRHLGAGPLPWEVARGGVLERTYEEGVLGRDLQRKLGVEAKEDPERIARLRELGRGALRIMPGPKTPVAGAGRGQGSDATESGVISEPLLSSAEVFNRVSTCSFFAVRYEGLTRSGLAPFLLGPGKRVTLALNVRRTMPSRPRFSVSRRTGRPPSTQPGISRIPAIS